MNVFQGGFLGLDNIGVFDRSSQLPTGGHLEQSDGTSWMAMYSLNLLAIALELAPENPAYEDVASKFWEHFLYIAHAMNNRGQDGIGLWDEADGFFYDVLHLPDGSRRAAEGALDGRPDPALRRRDLEPEILDRLPAFKRRLDWFIANRPDLTGNVACMRTPGHGRAPAARRWSGPTGCAACSQVMLDEREFLSPLRRPGVVAPPPGRALRARRRRPRASGGLRAGRVVERPVRRQLELARARSGSRSTTCSSRRCRSSTTTSATTSSVACPTGTTPWLTLPRGGHGALAAADAHLPARRAGPPAGVRRTRRCSTTIRTGGSWCHSTSTSTGTRAPASARATRRAGPPSSPSSSSSPGSANAPTMSESPRHSPCDSLTPHAGRGRVTGAGHRRRRCWSRGCAPATTRRSRWWSAPTAAACSR